MSAAGRSFAHDTPAQPAAALSVCIATYRRAAQLAQLLDDLFHQTRLPQQIVIVDNDPQGSARPAVQAARERADAAGIELCYDIQPEKNISLTRNRTLAHASGSWIAFIDDDERASPQWLALLEAAAQAHQAQAILAPVLPQLPPDAPAWLARGRFYDGPRMPTGQLVPRNVMRIGNGLICAAWLKRLDPVFDPAYGLTGGEDGDMLMRLDQAGARIVWCDEAAVDEPVPPSRLKAGWLLRRALRGGQDYAQHFHRGRLEGPPGFGRKLAFHLRAAAQMAAAALLALMTLPLGLHHSLRWLMRACANFGKLSVLLGWHYREYA